MIEMTKYTHTAVVSRRQYTVPRSKTTSRLESRRSHSETCACGVRRHIFSGTQRDCWARTSYRSSYILTERPVCAEEHAEPLTKSSRYVLPGMMLKSSGMSTCRVFLRRTQCRRHAGHSERPSAYLRVREPDHAPGALRERAEPVVCGRARRGLPPVGAHARRRGARAVLHAALREAQERAAEAQTVNRAVVPGHGLVGLPEQQEGERVVVDGHEGHLAGRVPGGKYGDALSFRSARVNYMK